MASNTKLTKAQKAELREFKLNYMTDNMAFATCGPVTVLVQVTGNVVHFATSVSSPDEVKFRRKVGEYCAMERLLARQTAFMPNPGDISAQEAAGYLASVLA